MEQSNEETEKIRWFGADHIDRPYWIQHNGVCTEFWKKQGAVPGF
jgi:hypothetical protein